MKAIITTSVGICPDESSLGVDGELKCLHDSRYDRGLNANVFTL